MKKFIIHGTITVITFFVSMLATSQANQLVGARFPAAAPDGKQIAFSYMGDLWVISASGGKAVQLTNHIGYDHKPIWSADGKWLAFTSNRQGNNDVYVMKSSSGSVKQLTFHTSNDIAPDFTPDGK